MAYTKKKVVKLWTKEKAALYVRVSTRYQVDKDSLPFQRKKLKEYCKFHGIEDSVVFEDDGYSAKNTDRPRFQEMMNRVRSGEFSHIIVYKVDRVSRNLLDFAAMYQELKEHKVTFISLNEQFDTSTAIGEAMLKIILIFAELERNMTSERVTGIMLNRAEEGLWNGARMPVGFRWNAETKFPEPDPEERKIVQFIFDEYERVKSCLQISRHLNNNNYKSKRGGQWTSKLIHDIIRNPFYIGTYRYNLREAGRGPLKPESEWIIRENNHEGIIDKEQFKRCNEIMDVNGKKRDTSETRIPKHVHTFSGKLVCGKCGANMIATKDRIRSNGFRPSMYHCSRRARMLDCDNVANISESYIGPFIFNYAANLTRLQKNFRNIKSIDALNRELLKGEVFDEVERIDTEDLKATFQAISFHAVKKGSYMPDIDFLADSGALNRERVEILRGEVEKAKNAISRLTDLYLYDSDSMTKEEFSSRRKEMAKNLESLEEQLSELMESSKADDVADVSFIKKASAFLVARRMVSKDFIDYISMAIELDNEILKDFVDQIIDKIVVVDGRVTSIQFVNGLQHNFINKPKKEIVNCVKCGGRIGTTCGCRARTFDFDKKRIQRIKVGSPGDDFEKKKNPICPDCFAQEGRWHHWKCTKERCPICGEYLATCEHGAK